MENMEFEVLDAFEHTLKSNLLKELPSYELVYREVMCQQGSADFICFPYEKMLGTYDFSRLSSLENGSLVLSLLKYNSGRTKEYLKERTNIADAAFNRVLKELKANNFIVKRKNLYFLSESFVQENDNLWAFEVKATSWKRALLQATMYKAFANYVVAVMPFEEEEVLVEKLDLFTEMNVGVLLFDSQSLAFKWLRRPLKEAALSKWQKFFFLGKISGQHFQESLFSMR